MCFLNLKYFNLTPKKKIKKKKKKKIKKKINKKER